MPTSKVYSRLLIRLRNGLAFSTAPVLGAIVRPTDFYASGMWLLYLRSKSASRQMHGGSFAAFTKAWFVQRYGHLFSDAASLQKAMIQQFPFLKPTS